MSIKSVQEFLDYYDYWNTVEELFSVAQRSGTGLKKTLLTIATALYGGNR